MPNNPKEKQIVMQIRGNSVNAVESYAKEYGITNPAAASILILKGYEMELDKKEKRALAS